MTHHDKDHYSKKHPEGRQINEKIADAVKKRASKGEIPCAVAFEIVDELKVSPDEAGFTIDSLEIKVVKCQLGLFGYRPEKSIVKAAEKVSPSLEQAIKGALVKDRLPCRAAWDIAERQGLKKMEISSACEALGIKISPCQLGAF